MTIGQSEYSFRIALLIGCYFLVVSNAIGPQVNTTVGMIEGSLKTVTDGSVTRDINIFLGVPYAEPPVGDNRFTATRSKTRMSELYNATDFRPICPQDKEWLEKYNSKYPASAFNMNEDCLYLNIYAPVGVSSGSSPMATMIYIHGGAYIRGTANVHDGSILATIGEVVVVTINYRLGALGFLSRGTKSVEGNYGFTDQYFALKWVFDNVEKFGGDKKNITLFGESAGASSVALHSIIPGGNKLFKRVILESGSALNPWSLANKPAVYSLLLSVLSGCDGDMSKLYSCLREKPLSDILAVQKNMTTSFSSNFIFGPVINNVILSVSPKELYNGIDPRNVTEKFAEIDHLIGANSQEGAFIYNTLMGRFRDKVNDTAAGLPRNLFNQFVEEIAKRISPNHSNNISSALKAQYTNHSDVEDGFQAAKDYIDIVSDSIFYQGIIQWAQLHAKAANQTSGDNAGTTFFYYYDHRGNWVSEEPWRNGADHADELPLVFGLPFTLTTDEKDLSRAMMTYWTNFAKTGDPNSPNPVTYPVTWPKYVIGDESYIRLTAEKTTSNLIGQKLLAERVSFWEETIPNLLSSLSPPTTPEPRRTTKKPPAGGAATAILNLWVLSCAALTGLLLSK